MKGFAGIVRVLSALFIYLVVFGGHYETKSAETGERDKNWFAAASEAIRDMEYEASFQNMCAIPGLPGAYHIANRAQNLRAYFFRNSVKIIRRTDLNPDWILDVSVAGCDGPSSITIHKNALFPSQEDTFHFWAQQGSHGTGNQELIPYRGRVDHVLMRR
ncbi:hypothetical protein JW926_08885 [Candidatus Sumerlaeota bacterium]|nr:hypothetical protein [Candidatus Sumerlaeota bacterium]